MKNKSEKREGSLNTDLRNIVSYRTELFRGTRSITFRHRRAALCSISKA